MKHIWTEINVKNQIPGSITNNLQKQRHPIQSLPMRNNTAYTLQGHHIILQRLSTVSEIGVL